MGIIYERRHTRMIADFGGLSRPMPNYAIYFMIIALSSMGLPAMNGFIGEFTILSGAFDRNWVWALLGATGIILGAAYMLWMYQRVFYGKTDERAEQGSAGPEFARKTHADSAHRPCFLDRPLPQAVF